MSAFVRDLFNNVLSHFFQSVPRKSYTFEADEMDSRHQIRLKSNKSSYVHCHRVPDRFEAFFTASSSGNQIACLMIKAMEPTEPVKYTILFSHGGTVDLGQLCNFLFTLGRRLSCNVFIYDYSGFGQSAGTPTEKAVYADAETAFNLLTTKYHVPTEKIVLYGQSLGTAPSLHLATNFASSECRFAGLILHSPFLSAARLYFPKMHRSSDSNSSRFYDFFKNITMIEKVQCPVLIMHGTRDRVVPISHSKELHERAGEHAVAPLWIEGGGHDDLYTFEGYVKRLKRFIDHDLPNTVMTNSIASTSLSLAI